MVDDDGDDDGGDDSDDDDEEKDVNVHWEGNDNDCSWLWKKRRSRSKKMFIWNNLWLSDYNREWVELETYEDMKKAKVTMVTNKFWLLSSTLLFKSILLTPP